MTSAGAMREVVRLQNQTTVQDGTGQPRLVWGELATRRAEMTQTPGTETTAGPGRVARVPTEFRIRYPREFAVTPKLRLVHRDRVFNIISASDPDGRRVDMVLTCEEQVGEVP